MCTRLSALQMWSGPLQTLSVGTFLGHEVALDFSPLLSCHWARSNACLVKLDKGALWNGFVSTASRHLMI